MRSLPEAQLAPTGEQHRRPAIGQQLPQAFLPFMLQVSQQQIRGAALQHPGDAGHGQLHSFAAGIRQQRLQLLIGQGHMGSHHHQPGERLPGRITAPQGRQSFGIQRLRTQGLAPAIHQTINQARSGAKQKTSLPLQCRHGSPQGIQLLLVLRIHHHRLIAIQCLQPGHQRLKGFLPRRILAPCRSGARKLLPRQPHHRRGRNRSSAFLLQPGIQVTGAEAEAAVAGEGGGVHRLAIEPMLAIDGGAAAGEKRRHMQGGLHGAEAIGQFLRQHLRLQHAMAPQGGITPTHQHQIAGVEAFALKRLIESRHDLAIPRSGGLRRQGPGVGKHKQQR